MLLNSCRYFLLFFLFEANLAIAQTNAPVLPKKYYERVDFAYAHYRTGDYKVSARAFEEAFAAFDGKGRPEDRYNAARAWAFMDDRREVVPEDVQAILPSVAGHRLYPVTGYPALGSSQVAERLIADVPIP